MKKEYQGSFSIEAACVMPFILVCICIAIDSGINLHEEIKAQVIKQEKQEWLDAVACMYRKEFIKDVIGEWYED